MEDRFKDYEALMEKYIGTFHLEKDMAIRQKVSSEMHEIEQMDRSVVLRLFRKYAEQQDVARLWALMEYVRAEGVFYADHTEPDTHTLRFMLTLATTFSKDEQLYENEWILRFISTLFDTIFHQIRFEEFPDTCAEQYFSLISNMLEVKFAKLPREEYTWFEDGYQQSMYFIGMTNPLFRGRDAFLFLWEKVLSHIGPGHIAYFDDWKEIS